MNLRQIELFIAVADAGSFSRGAEAVSLTQSTVSQHIAMLEDEVGTRLLDRTGKGARLTVGGKLLLEQARRILAARDELQRTMADFCGLHDTVLTIGASNIPANYLIPRVLMHWATEHPGVTLEMQTGSSQAMLERLAVSAVEVAVVGSRSDDPSFMFTPCASDLLVLAVGPQHPWSKSGGVTIEELCEGTMVVRESGSGSAQALEQALHKAGFEPDRLRVAARLGSNEAVRQTVANGFGAAFLSETSIKRELGRGELVRVAVQGLTVERQLWLAVLRGRTLSPAAELFARMLVEE